MAKRVVLDIGKYRGQSLDDVLQVDPKYFFWLRAQADLLHRKPQLARALEELGVGGDHTPLHNAVQALFLEDAICERLARWVWGASVDQQLRRDALWRRRQAIMQPVTHVVQGGDAKRTRLLRDLVDARKEKRFLAQALGADDDGLMAAVEAARSRGHYGSDHGLQKLRLSTYGKSVEEIRAAALEREPALQASLDRYRKALVDLRLSLNKARRTVAELTEADVPVKFTLHGRRMEPPNGSDVHFRCTLSAWAQREHYAGIDLTLYVEVKPFVGDDYPALLRQLNIQRRLLGEYSSNVELVAVVGLFQSQAVNLAQVRKIFREAGYGFVLLGDLGASMPHIEALPPPTVSDPDLFG